MKIKKVLIAIGTGIVTILGVVIAVLIKGQTPSTDQAKIDEKKAEKEVKKAEKAERKAQKAHDKAVKKATQTKRDLFQSHNDRHDDMSDLIKKKD